MRRIRSHAWWLAVVSGILQVLIFPSPGLYFLAWIAIAPLILAVLRPYATGVPPTVDGEGRVVWRN